MDIFLKFGSERDMNDLLLNGTIYCKPISYFAQKDDSCRFDKNELVVRMHYHENSIIHLIPIDEPTKKITLNASNLRHRVSLANPVGNLYCLFLTTIDTSLPIIHSPFDARLKEFGTHCVGILNNTEFFRRIFDQLKKNKIEYGNDDITYKDLSKFTGKKDLFTKGIEYSWQKEYRIQLVTGINEPYVFSIGSIEDIAFIMDTADIENKVFVNASLIKET
ncbi:MAG: hypothetical protein WC623_07860 [Pedobacter sp.]|uniref:hypothetical protein n=1 Tax=Pedobacter sp. TaxID=1411316 RepID=UPI0035648C4F